MAFEAELLGWTGHPDEASDQIDAAAYAAVAAERASIKSIRLAARQSVVT
jgi:hypothetical protein